MKIIEKIDSMISEAQSKLDELNSFKSDAQAELVAEYNRGWDDAMAQAGSGGSTDKIYSEQEMNQIIADTKAPLEAAIADLKSQVDGMQAKIDESVAAAVSDLKGKLKAARDAEQSAENVAESEFSKLLEE